MPLRRFFARFCERCSFIQKECGASLLAEASLSVRSYSARARHERRRIAPQRMASPAEPRSAGRRLRDRRSNPDTRSLSDLSIVWPRAAAERKQ